MATMPAHALHRPVIDWYRNHARALPWREPSAGPWAVLVSEVMLQQTPVARVLPAYEQWMARWPAPAALAEDASGHAVRQWGRLGYPRRALRLHSAAAICVQRYGGSIPSGREQLRALPGVGDYTAAAVSCFAYGRRQVVLDTNVRRVLARLLTGAALSPVGAPRVAERAAAQAVLPDPPARAAQWSVAVMELGALVCSTRSPRCGACPVASWCQWRAAGYPAWQGPPRPAQRYAGTDRAARGALLEVLRVASGPVARAALEAGVADPAQRERCLDALVAEALIEQLADGRFTLPGLTLSTGRRLAPGSAPGPNRRA